MTCSSKPFHSAFEPAPDQERGAGVGSIDAIASENLARRTRMGNGAINLQERMDVFMWFRHADPEASNAEPWADGGFLPV